jgi:hypothetical protein
MMTRSRYSKVPTTRQQQQHEEEEEAGGGALARLRGAAAIDTAAGAPEQRSSPAMTVTTATTTADGAGREGGDDRVARAVAEMEEAVAKMVEVASYVNEAIRERERTNELYRVQCSLRALGAICDLRALTGIVAMPQYLRCEGAEERSGAASTGAGGDHGIDHHKN